ncbi:MAG: energy-coupling factor transporter ATPase [Bacillales bacterium]|nr:energy-coupling factor transporter ATPase [Bacillales bacterium]
MDHAIKITNLCFGYDKKTPIFNDLSLHVEKGEYVAIIGHNGSGKSTLAKLIIGLLEASSGKIEIFGKELNEENVYELRSKMGIVFQNPDNQFTGATVADDIAFGLENKCVKTEEMDEIILKYATKVGMEKFLDKEPTALSGGQKQRVAIAGVLAMQPELIIMDESTAMLDPKGKKEIRDIVKSLRSENPNLTVLSITHDIEEAFDSDRVICINHGSIVFNDTPNNVFAHEKELSLMNLSVPFVFQLRNELKRNGISIDTIDEKEMVNELCL